MKNVIYDCEIIKCIPPKDAADWHQNLEYCGGWRDFENMGISVIGACLLEDGAQPDYRAVIVDDLAFNRSHVDSVFNNADRVIGFNSRNFDDSLCKANGFEISTTYDLLEEVRIAAGYTAKFTSVPKGFSYSLDAIAKANGTAKTGHGALAPALWQAGELQEVIDYCMNDVKITYEILMLGLSGKLIDPNTGNHLEIAPLR